MQLMTINTLSKLNQIHDSIDNVKLLPYCVSKSIGALASDNTIDDIKAIVDSAIYDYWLDREHNRLIKAEWLMNDIVAGLESLGSNLDNPVYIDYC